MTKYDNMKNLICTCVGTVGAAIADLFGGWNASLTTLITFMIIDYVSGLVVAGIFKASTKTESGALESNAGWKGLFKKGMTLLIVLISYRLDIAIGTNYIRDAVCIGFIANESISIIENAGLMGVPVPDAIVKAIDVLKNKSDAESEEKEDGY